MFGFYIYLQKRNQRNHIKKLKDKEWEVFKNKLIELEGVFRKVIGSSIIRDTVLVIELKFTKVKGVSMINLTWGVGMVKMEKNLESRHYIELLGGTHLQLHHKLSRKQNRKRGVGEVRKTKNATMCS